MSRLPQHIVTLASSVALQALSTTPFAPPSAAGQGVPRGRTAVQPKRRQAIRACRLGQPCWHGGRAVKEGYLATQKPEARAAGQDNATCRAEPNGVVRPHMSSG